jgi:ligand-binding sensor domain-containing protein/signal transduction histidine kinase
LRDEQGAGKLYLIQSMVSKRQILLFTFCSVIVLTGVNSVALDPQKAITQYHQDFWSEENGLPQASVQAITQTTQGYIWVGTRGGLARFDGTKFTTYRGEEHAGLLSDDVRSLFQDTSGRLWIGTFNGGVTCFENESFRSYSTRDGLTASGVLNIFQDSKGALWFGAWRGIARLKDGKFQSFQKEHGLDGQTGWTIWEQEGLVRAATEKNLHTFDGSRFTPDSESGRIDDLRSVFVDRQGNTWIVTLHGLIRMAGGQVRRFTSRDGLADTRIRSIAEDGDGNIWVGTFNGLSRIQGEKIDSIPKSQTEPLNGMIEALFVDRDQSLWIGIRGGGLARLRDAQFSNLTTREGLPSNLPRCVFQASDGAVWIGSDGGGLAKVRDGKITTLLKRDGLPSDFVATVAEASDGTIWAGLGRPPAIAAIKNSKVERTLGKKEGLAFDYSVRSLLIDRRGILWAGGDGGLFIFDGKQLRPVIGNISPPVRVIAEDRDGRIWAGSETGLCLIEDERLKSVFTVRDGLSHNAIYSIYQDSKGIIWLGTQQGLTRFLNGNFRALTREKGGFQGTIYQVLEDSSTLWTLTSRGISSMKKVEIEAALDGSLAAVDVVTFGTGDGLKSSQGQGGSQSPGCKTADGRLWFATLNGVAVLSPHQKDPHKDPPPVLIEELWANRKLFRPSERNFFAADTDDFEFHYTALKFITPERAQFRYQLVGHDQDWIYAKSRRAAYYSNLRPGDYSFRVAASSDGINWSEPLESSPFNLRPHFYQTIWFYLSCLAAVGAAAWSFHRYRLRLAEQRFTLVLNERTRIARDLHDTLAQGFAGTAYQLEALRSNLAKAPPETKQHLDLALTMVRHSFTEAKRAVMNLRSSELQNGDLVAAVARVGEQMLGGTGVELSIRTNGKARPLDAETEDQLLRICQEAIANSLKHANATRLEIIFDFAAQPFVSIRDNGIGFDPEKATERNGHHFGIQGMNERMKQLGGALEIKSGLGAGTEVLIRLN